MRYFIILVLLLNGSFLQSETEKSLPLFYWQSKKFVNFGDYLSLKLVQRIVGGQVDTPKHHKEQKLLAIGSVLLFAKNNDIIWGTGMNGKRMDLALYKFKELDVRAVRGPKTRQFLQENFGIECPEVYGDPALLIPYFFPEFKKPEEPLYDYIIIPHYTEIDFFPKSEYPNVVYPTEPWNVVIRKILNSKFVISSSLHGLIVAEAYNIPARYLRCTENEPLFKYEDYYMGTNRQNFEYATTIDEALKMGGEPEFECDLETLYNAFPFDYWPGANLKNPFK